MGYQPFIVKPDKLAMLIRAYGIDGVRLGKIIGKSHDTGRRRISEPGELTVSELRRLMKHIPREEILSVL